jgi:hypothetical protein
MPDLMTQLDRVHELSEILLAMTREYDMKKFWALDRKFRDLKAIFKLEDELNGLPSL